MWTLGRNPAAQFWAMRCGNYTVFFFFVGFEMFLMCVWNVSSYPGGDCSSDVFLVDEHDDWSLFEISNQLCIGFGTCIRFVMINNSMGCKINGLKRHICVLWIVVGVLTVESACCHARNNNPFTCAVTRTKGQKDDKRQIGTTMFRVDTLFKHFSNQIILILF